MKKLIPFLFLFACSKENPVLLETPVGNSIIGTIYCSDTVNYTDPTIISYKINMFQDGNVSVFGTIQVKTDIFTSTKQYNKTLVRTSDLPVLFKYDSFMSNNGGNWMVSVDRSEMLMKMYYYDPKDNESVSFTSTKCSVMDLE